MIFGQINGIKNVMITREVHHSPPSSQKKTNISSGSTGHESHDRNRAEAAEATPLTTTNAIALETPSGSLDNPIVREPDPDSQKSPESPSKELETIPIFNPFSESPNTGVVRESIHDEP